MSPGVHGEGGIGAEQFDRRIICMAELYATAKIISYFAYCKYKVILDVEICFVLNDK